MVQAFSYLGWDILAPLSLGEQAHLVCVSGPVGPSEGWSTKREGPFPLPTQGLELKFFVASSLRHEEGRMESLGLFHWGDEQSPDLAPRWVPVQVRALPLLVSSVHSPERCGGSSLAGKGPAVLSQRLLCTQ